MVHSLKRYNKNDAEVLIKHGFSSDKVYRERRFVPCMRCRMCANMDYDCCNDGEEKEVDLDAMYICNENEYRDLIDLIKSKNGNNTN